MNQTLTLICNPKIAVLNNEVLTRTTAYLNELGAKTTEVNWLADGVACDIPFSEVELKIAETALKQKLQELPIDIIAQKNTNRQKKLLIADMDSTMVMGETLDDLAELAGYKEEVAAITRLAMNNELRFVDALKQRVKLLKGLSIDNLEKVMSRIKLTHGARELVQTMKANGAVTMLVSGGFTYFTDRVRDLLGFDEANGNNLEIFEEELTGQVLDPIIDNKAKLAILQKFTTKHQINIADTLAVGDGANDLPMLLEANIGVAYHAKPAVAKQVRISINHGDLTALLYLQGYRREEFII